MRAVNIDNDAAVDGAHWVHRVRQNKHWSTLKLLLPGEDGRHERVELRNRRETFGVDVASAHRVRPLFVEPSRWTGGTTAVLAVRFTSEMRAEALYRCVHPKLVVSVLLIGLMNSNCHYPLDGHIFAVKQFLTLKLNVYHAFSFAYVNDLSECGIEIRTCK